MTFKEDHNEPPKADLEQSAREEDRKGAGDEREHAEGGAAVETYNGQITEFLRKCLDAKLLRGTAPLDRWADVLQREAPACEAVHPGPASRSSDLPARALH